MAPEPIPDDPVFERLQASADYWVERLSPNGRWLLIGIGVAITFASELVFFVYGTSNPLVRVLELLLPMAVGVGLIWFGFQSNSHNFTSWQITTIGLAVLVGMAIFVVLATYMRVLLALEFRLAQEPVYLLVNAMAIGALVNFVYAYQYVRLKTRTRRYERQTEQLNGVIAQATHDLRNPLNVAAGYTDLLSEKVDDESRTEPLKGALERIETLVDELLILAHSKNARDTRETVRLEQLSDACWDLVETVDARLEIDGDLEFEADPDRLRHLFENLFRNAVEHTGGESTIRVGPLESGTGFYVADDGPGIPEDERERIFEPGYTTAEEGTGFGVTIVSEIAVDHGWEVSITESWNGGARFEFDSVETADADAAGAE